MKLGRKEHFNVRLIGRLIGSMGALLALAACSTLHGVPTRYAVTATVVEKINLTPDDLATLATVEDQGTRNTIVNKALAVVDLNFHEFVRRLNGDREDIAASSAGTALGLNLAGTLVESVAAKTNYAAFAAAMVGAVGILDKNYFYEKTVPALVAAMEAAREAVLLRIRTGQREALSLYSGSMALADLESYFSAGTILGAINTITTRADMDKALSTKDIRKLVVPGDDEISHRKTISNAILGINDASLSKGKAALKALNLPDHDTVTDVRLELLRAMRREPVDQSVQAVEKALKTVGLTN